MPIVMVFHASRAKRGFRQVDLLARLRGGSTWVFFDVLGGKRRERACAHGLLVYTFFHPRTAGILGEAARCTHRPMWYRIDIRSCSYTAAFFGQGLSVSPQHVGRIPTEKPPMQGLGWGQNHVTPRWCGEIPADWTSGKDLNRDVP